MKKILFILVIVSILIVGYAHDQFLWCKKLIVGDPTSYTIQKGEYLSKIAVKYYGNESYWRELALINRAPNSDLVFPGEEIIIPSKEVIEKIRRTRWLSRVNNFIRGEEDIIAGLHRGELQETEILAVETPPEEAVQTTDNSAAFVSENEEIAEKSSMPYLALGILGIFLLASLIGFLIYRKKKQNEQISIIDTIDLNKTDDEESEPNYQEYLNKKKKKEEVILN